MNDMVPTLTEVPEHLAKYIGQTSALSESIAAGLSSGTSHPRISLKGSRFRIVEDGAETVIDATYLEVIIVGANPRLSKMYYDKPWDPDAEAEAPTCSSLDGVSPDTGVEDPQSDLCATCPHNAWGSKTTPAGTKIKACPDQKRLAVVAANNPSGPVYLLVVTPAALKGLNAYQKTLDMRKIPAEIVRTRISFDTSASYPLLTFAVAGFIDEDTQEEVEKHFGSDEVLEITGEAVPAKAEPEPEPKPKPRKAAVRAKPEPEPEPESEPEPEPEPEPSAAAQAFGAAPAKEKPKAAKPKATRARAKPKADPVEVDDMDDLVAEIEALVGGDDG